MATNDTQAFLPLQPQVPVTPTQAPVQTAASDNPALRRALIVPTPAAPAVPVTADSLRSMLAALQPYANQLQTTPTAAVATPPSVAPTDAPPAGAAPATISTPTNPATDSQQSLRAGTPRVGQDATSAATISSQMPRFAAGSGELPQAPSAGAYNGAPGVEVIRNGVSSIVGGGGAPSTIGGRFVNPANAISDGYDQQLAYQQASLRNLLDAFAHSDGLAATKHALAQTIGLNNFGSVQGQGINTVNSALGNIGAAGMGAEASMYGSTLGYLSRADQLAFEKEQAANTPVQIGAEPMGIPDGKGGMIPTMALPTYGMRGKNGAAPTPVNPVGARSPAKYQENDKGTYLKQPVVYSNGKWVYKQ